MKKKYWKILALILALVLIVCLASFANSMLGNPISAHFADNAAQKYLSQQYPGSDYYIERTSYSFKDACYHAFVESPTSVDTYFSICINQWGQIQYDTFDSVESGWNTYRRLEEEYRALTDTIFENPAFPYPGNILFGKLEVYPRDAMDDPDLHDIADYALVQDDLILDKVYDIAQLGAQAGRLVVHVDTDTITFAKAAQIMLDIKKRFDDAGIPFYAMDFCLQYPLPAEGPRPDGDVRVEDFLYKDIYEKDLPARLEQAHQALQEYYEELDGK